MTHYVWCAPYSACYDLWYSGELYMWLTVAALLMFGYLGVKLMSLE